MADERKCPVCVAVPKQPKLLFCNHILCEECVDGLLTAGGDGESCERTVRCPSCSTISVLPSFGTAASLRPAPTEDAPRGRDVSSSTAHLGGRCVKHGCPAEIYCEDCLASVCSECVSADHLDHSCNSINNVAAKYRQEIIDCIDVLGRKILSALDGFAVLSIQEKEIIEQGEAVLDKVDEYVREIMEAVQNAGEELKMQVRKEVDQKVEVILKRKEADGIALANIMSCSAYVDDVLQRESHQLLLLEKNETMERLRTACKESTVEELPVNAKLDIMFQRCSDDILEKCGKIGEIIAVEEDELHCVDQKDTHEKEQVGNNFDMLKDMHSPSAATAYQQPPTIEETGIDDHMTSVPTVDDSSDDDTSVNSRAAIVGRSRTVTLPRTHTNFEVKGPLSCHLIPQDGGKAVRCQVQQLEDNRCRISFTPSQEGLHQVKLQGEGDVLHEPCTVQVVPTPEIQSQLVRTTEKLRQCTGLALFDKHLLVTELFGKVVAVLDEDGRLVKRFKHVGGDYLSSIAVTLDHHLIVLSQNEPHLTQYTGDYTLVATANSCHGKGPLEFDCPRGVAVSGSTGHIYVCDTGNNRIQVLNPDLTFSHKFGRKGNRPGQFNTPYGIAIDSQDMLYVCDYGNNRIQKLASDGRCIKEFKVRMPLWAAIDSDVVLYVVNYSSSKFYVLMYDIHGGCLGRKEVPQRDRFVGVAVDQQYLYLAKEMEVSVFSK